MDILEREEFRKRGGVPQAYFSDLQDRLMAIPEVQRRTSRWSVAAPYAALAACFALLVSVGTFMLGRTPASEDYVSYDDLMLADMIPHTDPFLEAYDSDDAPESLTAEELIDFLMDSNYRPDEDDIY